MGKVPDMPQGVILQSVLFNAEGEMSGYRIYADGRYESKTVNTSWESADPLTPDQVTAIIKAIAESQFTQLSSHYEPSPLPKDANTLWMQVEDGGKRFDIEIVGSCEVPAIQTLSARIMDVFRAPKP